MSLFFSTLLLIFLAELPDKTAFATLLLATQANPFALFCGIAIAFLLQSIVSVAAGSVIGLIPSRAVHIVSAALFLVFAVAMWRRKPPEQSPEEIAQSRNASFAKTAWTGFVVIFLAEWGDLTQLATISLAAQYNHPAILVSAATLGLWASTGVMIWIGNRARSLIRPAVLQRVAAFALFVVGIYMLLEEARAC